MYVRVCPYKTIHVKQVQRGGGGAAASAWHRGHKCEKEPEKCRGNNQNRVGSPKIAFAPLYEIPLKGHFVWLAVERLRTAEDTTLSSHSFPLINQVNTGIWEFTGGYPVQSMGES